MNHHTMKTNETDTTTATGRPEHEIDRFALH